MFTNEDSFQHKKLVALLGICVLAGEGALSLLCRGALCSLMVVLMPGFSLNNQQPTD
jgi:hypothetical protein